MVLICVLIVRLILNVVKGIVNSGLSSDSNNSELSDVELIVCACSYVMRVICKVAALCILGAK